jgi:hypothetical protein
MSLLTGVLLTRRPCARTVPNLCSDPLTPGRAMLRPGRIRFVGLVATLALATILALTPNSASAALPIAVNDTADRPDRNIGDGVCATAGGGCTLRAAIQESNALLGQDTINIGPGVYELEIPVVNEDTQSTGDHDIVDTVNIVGTGAGATFVDGGFPLPSAPVEARGIDRLFEIHPSAGNVTFRSLTIRDGYSDEGGGGIQNWSPGLLRLANVHVLDNLASKSGGGVNNDDPFAYQWPSGSLPPTATIPSGRVEIVGSKLAGNSSSEGGAAVNNVSSGSVSIVESEVVDNPGEMIRIPPSSSTRWTPSRSSSSRARACTSRPTAPSWGRASSRA